MTDVNFSILYWKLLCESLAAQCYQMGGLSKEEAVGHNCTSLKIWQL